MTGSFEALVAALAVFVATHSLPAVRPLRRALVGALGERGYVVLYSMVSLAALGWVVTAAASAPYVALWPYQPWTAWVPTIVMVPACVLFVCGAAAPNPLSIGRRTGFDPERPGIVAVTRHPVLWAFVLWSGAHLVPNGALGLVIMFGVFLVFGVAGMPLLDTKRRRALGVDRWTALAERTSTLPFAAVLARRTAFRWREIGGVPLAGSAALYALLIALHERLFGAWPLPIL